MRYYIQIKKKSSFDFLMKKFLKKKLGHNGREILHTYIFIRAYMQKKTKIKISPITMIPL